MKKILLYTFIAAASALATSCNDYLDAIFYKFRIGGKVVSVTEQHLYVDFVYPAISLIIAG